MNQENKNVRKFRHKARAVKGSHEFGHAGTGTEQVGVRFTLIGGDLDGQGVIWYGYFTDASAERTLESLKYAGWTGVFGADLDLPGLGDTEVELQLEEETGDEGQSFLSVAFVNKISVAMKSVMSSADRVSFAARMQAYGVRSEGQGQRPAPRQAAGAARPQAQPQQRGQQQRPAQQRGTYQRQDPTGDDAPPPGDNDNPYA